ncbi:hypothetical protein, partial [Paenibacillus polymyxa]|uniref:hypothetical protein n=1 Tax=Paenibacillus polymyxa TaxID=1406 RepID=UPI000ADA6888
GMIGYLWPYERFGWSLSQALDFVDPSLTVVSLRVVLSLAFVVYLFPLVILYRKEDWYLTIEVTVTGFFIFI